MFKHVDYLQFQAKPEKPDALFAAKLQELSFAGAEDIAAMREEARVKAIEARKKSLSDPMPVPDREEERVYA